MKLKIHEILLHLTGGSIQQINLHDHGSQKGAFTNPRIELERKWKAFKNLFNHDTLIIAQADSKAHIRELDGVNEEKEPATDTIEMALATTARSEEGTVDSEPLEVEKDDEIEDPDATEQLFKPGRLYTVQCIKEVGSHIIVLVHNPWGESSWEGHWSQHSSKWDDFPEVLFAVQEDPRITWTRENPGGYFWLPFKVFLNHFSQMFVCKLFPNTKFTYYCARGEWKDDTCGGSISAVREKEAVIRDATASRAVAFARAVPAVSIDGDHSWFCNPQYRVHAHHKAEVVYISLVPLAGNATRAPVLSFTIVSTHVSQQIMHVWDISVGSIVANEAKEGCGKVKGQECSLWRFTMDPKFHYHIIPNANKKSATGSFILRIFSHDHLTVESMGPLFLEKMHIEWRRSGDVDNCGGPPLIQPADSDTTDDEPIKPPLENSKWCQNPQIYLSMKSNKSKVPVQLKIVMRKTDKTGASVHSDKKDDAVLSFVVCRPEFLREVNMKKSKRGVRENALGQALPSKESSLKKEKQSRYVLETTIAESQAATGDETNISNPTTQKQIVKRVTLATDTQYFQTSGSSDCRNETCLYFPDFPRQLLNDGLMIIPSLSGKGSKGHASIEVYCSEQLRLQQLSDKKLKILAGEWDEKCAMGSHINGLWKKNPKFTLRFKPRSNPTEKFRICLNKFGDEHWKKVNRKDHIGSMIGFYIFMSKRGDVSQFFESAFVPDREIATDDNFTLEALGGPDDEYIIMPATFSEGVVGQFVLSVMADCEFSLHKKVEPK